MWTQAWFNIFLGPNIVEMDNDAKVDGQLDSESSSVFL